MPFWTKLWLRLQDVPAGVWAAILVGGTILGLYLRGRRLEAKLAESRVALSGARAKADIAKDRGRAEVFEAQAEVHASHVEDLESARVMVREVAAEERERLQRLEPEEISEEYIRLAREKADRLGT